MIEPDIGVVSDLLKPYDARLMRCYPVNTRVSNVANDEEECSVPVEVAETHARWCKTAGAYEAGMEHAQRISTAVFGRVIERR